MDPDPYCGRLGEDYPEYFVQTPAAGHHRQKNAGPSLFHDDGDEIGVVRPRFEEAIDDKGVDLRVHVVDIRLDHQEVFFRGCGVQFADHDAEKIGNLIDFTRPRSVPDRLYNKPLAREDSGRHGFDNRRTGRGGKLVRDVGEDGWVPFKNLKSRGARNRQIAVLCLRAAAASQTSRRGVHGLNAEPVETDCRADDVDDRVEGSDFMEMDFLDCRVVDPCLGGRDFVEDLRRVCLDGSREAAFFNDAQDLIEMAMLLSGPRDDDLDFNRGDAVPLYMRSFELDAGEVEFGDFFGKLFDRKSRAHESRKRHVPADSGHRIEVCYFHPRVFFKCMVNLQNFLKIGKESPCRSGVAADRKEGFGPGFGSAGFIFEEPPELFVELILVFSHKRGTLFY